MFEPISPETERLATSVLDAAFVVHRALGPGLVEPVYEACLKHELSKRGVPFRSQVIFPVTYDGVVLDAGLRLDLLVGEYVIVEFKAVEKHNPLFEAQLLTYMKLTGHRLGLLLNFNVPLLKNGIKRLVR